MTKRHLEPHLSISGIDRVFSANLHPIRRSIWAIFITAGAAFLVYHMADRISHFSENPTTIDLDINHRTKLQFPMVTICNYNSYKTVEAAIPEVPQTYRFSLEVLHYLMREHDIFDTSHTMPFARNEMFRSEEWSASGYFNKSTPKQWLDLITILRHHPKELIIYCTINGERCEEITEDFKDIPFTLNGYSCYAFNSKGLVTAKSPGLQGAFRLILNAETDFYAETDYEITLPEGTGAFWVDISHPEEMQATMRDAFLLPAGKSYNVMIKRSQMFYHPKYGNCAASSSRRLEHHSSYRRTHCIASCITDEIRRSCGCLPPFWMQEVAGVETCVPATRGYDCAADTVQEFSNATEEYLTNTCTCPVDCNMTLYEKTIYPAAEYPDSPTLDAKSVLEVVFYYQTFQETVVTQKMSYTWLTLLSEVGGCMGLVIGSCLLTLCEALDYLAFDLGSQCFNKRRDHKQRTTGRSMPTSMKTFDKTRGSMSPPGSRQGSDIGSVVNNYNRFPATSSRYSFQEKY